MIDLSQLQQVLAMEKKKELLKKHPYKISQGSDGKWRTYLPDKEKGRRLVKRGTKKSVEDVVIAYWETELENPTIREVFEEWNDRRLELKKISEATHLRNCQVFNRHYKEFGLKRIKSVSAQDFEEFLEEQIPEHHLTSRGFSNLKSVTHGFLKRAKKRKLIEYNVEEIFDELDVSDKDFKKVIKEDYEEVFSEEEMPIMMNYLIQNPDIWNLGILLMFVTGARIGEVVALKHEDFVENTFKIRRTETRYLGEDGKYVYAVKDFPKSQAGVRTAIIPKDYAWIASALQEHNANGEYIFTNNGKRLTTQCIRMRLKKVCKKIGIYHKSPHKIRKTYGTILLDNHIDNRLILGQMGHTDVMCTEVHYHRNRKTIEKKGVIISGIPEFQRENVKMITG